MDTRVSLYYAIVPIWGLSDDIGQQEGGPTNFELLGWSEEPRGNGKDTCELR